MRLFLNWRGGSIARPGVDHGSQKDVPQSLDTEAVEVIFGEIQLESASEILDSSLKFVSSQSSN
jgi:hypothetical protein